MQPLKSVVEAAELLGISSWTVRSYIKAGKLKPVRIGRRVLLSEDELERLVRAGQGIEASIDVPDPTQQANGGEAQ